MQLNSDTPNRGGMLRYRCRMCGEEYENVHVPHVGVAIAAIINKWPNPWPHSGIWPRIVEPHWHKDGSGVADLIGGTVDK